MNLPQLLIASSLGLVGLTTSVNLMSAQHNNLQGLQGSESLRGDWEKASNFINTEIQHAERIYTDVNQINISSECNIAESNFRLAVDTRRNLPLTIYAVEESTDGWRGDNVLVRCGPAINSDGGLDATISRAVLIDGLKLTAAGGGFESTGTSQKLGSYSLALLGVNNPSAENSQTVLARINPLYTRPSKANLCGAVNLVKLAGDNYANTLSVNSQSIINGEDMLVCGFGGGDTIDGSWGNEIIECGSNSTSDTATCTLNGHDGNDVLRGAHGDDVLDGGSGNNILIGDGGNNELYGGDDQNTYLISEGANQVYGGNGLDVVFFEGDKGEFDISSSCSKASCTVTNKSSSLVNTLTQVNILIFDDSRLDLNESES